jgi:hypothetical protein
MDLLILIPKHLSKFLLELIIVVKYLLRKYLLFLVGIYNIVLKGRLKLLYSLSYKFRYYIANLSIFIREPSIIVFYI